MVANKFYDLSRLYEMLDGDKVAMLNMIQIFNQSTADLVIQIKDAFENNDLISVSKTAHNLKSSLAVFGIRELLDDFDRLITLARAETGHNEISSLIERADDVLALTCKQLEDYGAEVEREIKTI